MTIVQLHHYRGNYVLVLPVKLNVPTAPTEYIDQYGTPYYYRGVQESAQNLDWWLSFMGKLLIQVAGVDTWQTTITTLSGSRRMPNPGQAMAFDELVGERLAQLRKQAARDARNDDDYMSQLDLEVDEGVIAAIQARITDYVGLTGEGNLAYYQYPGDKYDGR